MSPARSAPAGGRRSLIRARPVRGGTRTGEHSTRRWHGAIMERPRVKGLLADVKARKVDCVRVYKVLRLDAVPVRLLAQRRVLTIRVCSAPSAEFNTSHLGAAHRNILLSFARFEREIISEPARQTGRGPKTGQWTGGHVPLGYDLEEAARGLLGGADRCGESSRVIEGHRYSILAKRCGLGRAQQAWTDPGRHKLRRPPQAQVPCQSGAPRVSHICGREKAGSHPASNRQDRSFAWSWRSSKRTPASGNPQWAEDDSLSAAADGRWRIASHRVSSQVIAVTIDLCMPREPANACMRDAGGVGAGGRGGGQPKGSVASFLRPK